MSSPLPLFPLNAHVLPGGRLPLRIFEPRYVRMVKQSFDKTPGFGMCMVAEDEQPGAICALGTRVEVIDFDTLEDGLLGITVEGKERFRLQRLWQEDDGLRMGEIEPIANWSPCPVTAEDSLVVEQLMAIHQQHPHLSALYPQPHWQDASWICQRWLEILPINALAKQALMEAGDCQPALEFLRHFLDQDDEEAPEDETGE